MAHFAQIDENNVVIQVIVVSNDDILDQNGNESETIGIEFCKNLLGQNTNWVQTSYNSNFRKNYAGIGFKYHQDIDAFVSPKPYPSWILNGEEGEWEAPVPYPNDPNPENVYEWNEDNLEWVLTDVTL